MKKYTYRAIDLQGKRYSGVYLAESERDLREKLSEQGMFLVSSRTKADKPPHPFFSLSGKVSASELSGFCRQFSIMIGSGTSIGESLMLLTQQAHSGYFKRVLKQVDEDVKAGKLLSEAMARHRHAFPDFFRSMVRIGEASGAIESVLNSLADYLETESKLRAKMRAALTYPTVLILMAVGIVVLMVAYVIPTFRTALAAMHVEMPALTENLYECGQWLRANWWIFLSAVFAAVGAWALFLRWKKGRYIWDAIKFRMPIAGKIVRNNVAARFCRAFSLLVGGGMDIVAAMEETGRVFGNAYARGQFSRAADDVRRGMALSAALQRYGLFPAELLQMISVGERTGELDGILKRSCSYFENRVERSILTVTSLLQPIILCLIGAAVGVLFYAVYSPMLQVMNSL